MKLFVDLFSSLPFFISIFFSSHFPCRAPIIHLRPRSSGISPFDDDNNNNSQYRTTPGLGVEPLRQAILAPLVDRTHEDDIYATNLAKRPASVNKRVGRPIAILTNHFGFYAKEQMVYQYAVEFKVNCSLVPLRGSLSSVFGLDIVVIMMIIPTYKGSNLFIVLLLAFLIARCRKQTSQTSANGPANGCSR